MNRDISQPRSLVLMRKNLLLSNIAPSLIVVVATILVGLRSLLEPFGRDQAEYATIADAMLRGTVIYRDLFNVKPPPTHLLHAVSLLLFGHSMVSIRILDLLWQIAVALVVYAIGWQVSRTRAVGMVATLLYVWFYFVLFTYWDRAQTDGFLNLFVALGVYAFLRGAEQPRRWVFLLSGAAIGLGALFKYPIGLLVVLLAGLLLVREHRRGIVPALMLGIGFAAPVLACAALLWTQGSLHAFLWIQTTYIPSYNSPRNLTIETLRYTLVKGGSYLLVLLPYGPINVLTAMSIVLHKRRGTLTPVMPIVLWLVAGWVHVIAQNKYYSYHGLPMLVPQALIIGSAVVSAVRRVHLLESRVVQRTVLAATLAAFLALPIYAYTQLASLTAGTPILEQAYSAKAYSDPDGDYSAAGNLQAAQYISANTKPGEQLFVWGFEPALYFQGAPPATSFIYNFPLYGDYASPELRTAFMAELERSAPTYIVVMKRDAIPWVTGTTDDSATALQHFDALRQYIGTNYTRETEIEDFTFYRRKET